MTPLNAWVLSGCEATRGFGETGDRTATLDGNGAGVLKFAGAGAADAAGKGAGLVSFSK